MTITVKVEGLKELDRALMQLPKATGKNVLRRVGRTLVFFPWSPSVSPDPEVARLAAALGTLGDPAAAP